MPTSKNNSIGIFDSGIGGLTIANAINKVLPNEHLIYFGDTAHLPYGEKSADAIRYYCLKICKFLIEQKCKMIVIACNSASTAAYDTIIEFFDGKILLSNVVDPLVQQVASHSYNKIGLIATKATVNSGVYEKKLKFLQPEVNFVQMATPLLVPMIEEGFYKGEVSDTIINNYLQNDVFNDIEALMLACTHYPLIKTKIENYFHHKIDVIDSTDVTATDILRILNEQNLLSEVRSSENIFYVSDYTKGFEETAKLFYGQDINLRVHSIW